MVYAKHRLSFWDSGILVHDRQRGVYINTPDKTPEAESLTHFPGRQYSTVVLIQLWQGNKACPMRLFWERILGSLCVVSSGLELWAFPFDDFTSYPFAVINLSHECNYLLVLWVFLANHQTGEWSRVLNTLNFNKSIMIIHDVMDKLKN